MAKVIKFPIVAPEKFGPERVRKKPEGKKAGQLNLFSGGKVVQLHNLSTFEEALMLDEQGDSATARNRYLKAIETGESPADSYCNLGIIEYRDGHMTKAVDYFTLCLKFDPRHFEAHYNLANLYADAGNALLAKMHYQIAIEMEPSFPNSYFNLGLTLAMNKEFPEAISAFNHYRTLTPDSDHTQANELIMKLSGR
ncbi:MAG TPA: tetratricopeptide repeat protein [Cyclobacteriaceae bacterium]|nr:tetratricopeptide repeat protein [Cyclobacteriaceae bacterium]